MATNSLEQRLYELLQPYHEECCQIFFSTESVAEEGRMFLILCENISFIIRHNQSGYGKEIVPTDVSVASRNWSAMVKGNVATAGVGIFVNGNGYTHTVMRCWVEKKAGYGLVEILTSVCDGALVSFFPEVEVEQR